MKRYWFIACLAGLVMLLDQLTKLLVMQAIPLWSGRPVIPGFFNLVHVQNRGAAFGFLNNPESDWQFWLFAGVTFVAISVLFYLAKTSPRGGSLLFAGIGLVLGGALGNFIDRCRFRHVVDFLDFYFSGWHWPAFNMADIGITCGVGLLVFSTLRKKAD